MPRSCRACRSPRVRRNRRSGVPARTAVRRHQSASAAAGRAFWRTRPRMLRHKRQSGQAALCPRRRWIPAPECTKPPDFRPSALRGCPCRTPCAASRRPTGSACRHGTPGAFSAAAAGNRSSGAFPARRTAGQAGTNNGYAPRCASRFSGRGRGRHCCSPACRSAARCSLENAEWRAFHPSCRAPAPAAAFPARCTGGGTCRACRRRAS